MGRPKSTPKYFWSKVDKSKECWEWTGCKDRDGYGQFGYNNRQWKAHRIAYFFSHGSIDDSKLICHHCDNPKCVRPEHLYQGTVKDNSQDMINRGRHKSFLGSRTHCSAGHEYNDENTYYSKEKRVCKICRRQYDKARYKRSFST